MRGAHVSFENAPRYAYAVAAVLVLALAYALLLLFVVLPALPAGQRPPAGMLVRLVVFTGGAIVLFALRSRDATAALSVLALALSGIANAGPTGDPWTVPFGPALTAVAWTARAFAFPAIALAILYFPSRSSLLERHPLLQAVPLLAAAPMLLVRAGTLYYASFATALAINLLALAEGVYRYRFNHDANERRRIRMAVYTAVPGVFAYAVHDGLPIVARLLERAPLALPAPVNVLLQALVLLPAFGLVYAVGVERVLGPRIVLRRSLQYALAARARQWLDQHFFREEYESRRILVSLASRVRFETDPKALAALVVKELNEALRPEMAAVMATEENGMLTAVSSQHRETPALPAGGGLATMLRWSDQPLEIFLHDPRSPARRLPPDEQQWLERTGATLLVPIAGSDRSLLGAIVLGEKRSEEAYSEEDRQLLASIASQVALGFDVERLRRGTGSSAAGDTAVTRVLTAAAAPMVECPRCGRCADPGTTICPSDGAPMQAVSSVPRLIDGKYRVEQLLGRGGMGAVYRARDVRLDRLVAVKVVRAELLGDPDARHRFRREAQIIARLQHPAIVSIFDYGTFADGGAYLVMELVRGEDLRRVLQREGRLEPDRALRILSSVCGAIEAAHREGVLHRDLKPENILLPGGEVEAKVLDFGVAKVMREERGDPQEAEATLLTAAGMIVGTPAYMAPEQLHGIAPDARSDVFSLGVVAFEMLSGQLPFGRGSLADIVLAHARGVPSSIGVSLPSELERAVRAALEPDPDRRPPTVQAFAQLLASAS